MDDNDLTMQLLRRIFNSIGAVAGSAFGLAGVTDQDHRYSRDIILEYEDKSRDNYPVWMGQIGIDDIFVALTNTDTKEYPEFSLVLLNNKDEKTVIGLYFDVVSGDFLQKHEDKWLPISVLYQLQVAQAFEIILQEGIAWSTCSDQQICKDLFDELSSLVECQTN